jgi:hypothetical protein
MKVFGAHNLKPLLALLDLSGPTKAEVTEEERTEVAEGVSFLQLLLGSPRHVVIFPNPELGCGNRAGQTNLLAGEVVHGLALPWERPDLSSLVAACAGTLPSLLGRLAETGEPRDAPAWPHTADLLRAVVTAALPPPPPQPGPPPACCRPSPPNCCCPLPSLIASSPAVNTVLHY